jgi:hypothetical protein
VYLGGSVAVAAVARDVDFLRGMAFDDGLAKSRDLNCEVFCDDIELESLIRRFFAWESGSVADVKSVREALFTSLEDNEVVDLFPIPLSRALNFRFVAFISTAGLKIPPE